MTDQTVEKYLGLYPGPGFDQYPSGFIFPRIAAIGPSACARFLSFKTPS
jgi:hypothetical protein